MLSASTATLLLPSCIRSVLGIGIRFKVVRLLPYYFYQATESERRSTERRSTPRCLSASSLPSQHQMLLFMSERAIFCFLTCSHHSSSVIIDGHRLSLTSQLFIAQCLDTEKAVRDTLMTPSFFAQSVVLGSWQGWCQTSSQDSSR